LWRDRVLLTNVVFSRRRMHSEPIDFGTNPRVFRGCTIKRRKALGRWRSGARGGRDTGRTPSPWARRSRFVSLSWVSFEAWVRCLLRQGTCIGRGVCAGSAFYRYRFLLFSGLVVILSRRGSTRTVEFFFFILGLRLKQYPPVPCFWRFALLSRGASNGIWAGVLGFVLIAQAVERLWLSRWSYGKIKRKQDRITKTFQAL
jgi:hypothetical protein